MDISLFGGVSAEDYTRMLTCLGTSPRTFRAGEVVLRYGDSKNIGIVESGCIRLERTDASGQRAILERVEAGGIFGELIAFSGISKDSYTFLSEGNSAVTLLPAEKIAQPCQRLCACHTLVISNLLSIVSQKAMLLSEHLDILSARTIRGKLMRCFALLSAKAGANSFTLPFSATALADYLCVDRSAMAREIGHMKEEGLLHMERRHITLTAPETTCSGK